MDEAFRAGLIAAEGSFYIGPNNGAQSWSCRFGLNLRADDTDLLIHLRQETGCGDVYPVAARGSSRPQTVWLVQRQEECLALATLLADTPLLNKKAGELAIWRAAVEAWTGGGERRIRRMSHLAGQLSTHRRFSFAPSYVPADVEPDYLTGFLAGFATGEAHFGATPEGWPHFRINLRRDDKHLLRALRDGLDLGHLAEVRAYRSSRPACSWRIARLREVAELVSILEQYPVTGRQGRVFECWRELVNLRVSRCSGRDPAVRRWVNKIRGARIYRPSPRITIRRGSGGTRSRCERALAECFAGGERRLTATRYEQMRTTHPEWPHRNTIVRTFGSWRNALIECEIPTTGTQEPARIAGARATAAKARAASAERRRSVVVASVRRHARELGRTPRATEFFRWRLANAPDSPAQATVYRLFPGGWAEVLEALDTD